MIFRPIPLRSQITPATQITLKWQNPEAQSCRLCDPQTPPSVETKTSSECGGGGGVGDNANLRENEE